MLKIANMGGLAEVHRLLIHGMSDEELRQRLATGAARAHKVERILAERAAPVVAPEPVIPVRRRRYLHRTLCWL